MSDDPRDRPRPRGGGLQVMRTADLPPPPVAPTPPLPPKRPDPPPPPPPSSSTSQDGIRPAIPRTTTMDGIKPAARPASEVSGAVPRRGSMVGGSLDPEVSGPLKSATEVSGAVPRRGSMVGGSLDPEVSVSKAQPPAEAEAQKKKLDPKKAAAAAAAVVVVLVIAVGVSTSGGTAAPSGPPLYTTADIQGFASRWIEEQKKANTFLTDTKLQTAVDRVARAAVPIEPPLRLLLLKTTEVDAFALPDGTVVVSVGMLKRLHSEAELAAVIAHVYAHAYGGHVARALNAAHITPAGQGGAAAAVASFSADDEEIADGDTVQALKLAGFASAALRTAFNSVGAGPWATRHPWDEDRDEALTEREKERLPGQGPLDQAPARMNLPEYQTRILARLPK